MGVFAMIMVIAYFFLAYFVDSIFGIPGLFVLFFLFIMTAVSEEENEESSDNDYCFDDEY